MEDVNKTAVVTIIVIGILRKERYTAGIEAALCVCCGKLIIEGKLLGYGAAAIRD
jgi:hypothetical protein